MSQKDKQKHSFEHYRVQQSANHFLDLMGRLTVSFCLAVGFFLNLTLANTATHSERQNPSTTYHTNL